jgi:hypothetical protein
MDGRARVDMDWETDLDGWASLADRRQAEDEALVRRYASGEGRGLDMRPVRGFVRKVRHDLGPAAAIVDVRLTSVGRGSNVTVWYLLDGRPEAAPAAAVAADSDVSDVPIMSDAPAATPQIPVAEVRVPAEFREPAPAPSAQAHPLLPEQMIARPARSGAAAHGRSDGGGDSGEDVATTMRHAAAWGTHSQV